MNRYWLFRSWGRTGTDIGGNLTSNCENSEKAIDKFKKIFKEKTKNEFRATNFINYPGEYHRLKTSEEEIKKVKLIQSSNLPKPVEELLKLLIDEDMMNNLMVIFQLDTTKSPLAIIGSDQIRQANFVLNEIHQKMLQQASPTWLVEASNRFYSLIPHSVTDDDVINNMEKFKEKAELLKSLRNMQIAYELLHKETGEKPTDILDNFYKNLNVLIEPLNRDSNEFKMITSYANDTQLNRDLVIEEIFKVSRSGETSRYKPYENLSNRTLLWHGSRIINYANILAHGLKIAPPEGGAIGSSFGKGLYFADVIGKAAGFCYAYQSNNIGLILLCEVALGDSLKLYEEENIEKLPDGYHSVHAVGKSSAQSNITLDDDVIVPRGKPIKNENIVSILNFNEFIIYNEAQVKIKYLIRLKFNEKILSN